mgnify:FL=1
MPVDPKGRTEAGYVRHAFICAHERPDGAARPSCRPKQSLDLMRQIKQRVREESKENIRVQKSGCLDNCEFGPTCVVYPEGTWYGLTTEGSIDALIHHLLTGEVSEDQTLKLV